MKQGTLKSLEYFVRKVCTIFVTEMPKHFTTQNFNDYFVGFVEFINEDGVMTTHPVTGCKNFFPYPYILGISEEQMLDPSKPADAELIKEIREKGIKPSMEVKESPTQFADIDIMADLARQAKEMERKK